MVIVANNRKVLIIDDDLVFLEELQDALSDSRYYVETVSDSNLALDEVKRVNPDIILLDLKMQQKNGFRVAKEIRAVDEYKNIPIIILSGMIDETSRYIAMKIGSIAFIEKPIEIDKLKFHIEDILNAEHTDKKHGFFKTAEKAK